MDIRVSAVLACAAGLILIGTAAQAACDTRHARNCVDLTLSPQASQQIVATGGTAAATTTYQPSQPQAYTGPTVGLNSMVRRAPEIGYRWSIE